ncbi:MAG: hypothetical protein JNM50_04085 [Chromatiales bacterium]|nr:hypothetical protein [Chromatiales bacterium]
MPRKKSTGPMTAMLAITRQRHAGLLEREGIADWRTAVDDPRPAVRRAARILEAQDRIRACLAAGDAEGAAMAAFMLGQTLGAAAAWAPANELAGLRAQRSAEAREKASRPRPKSAPNKDVAQAIAANPVIVAGIPGNIHKPAHLRELLRAHAPITIAGHTVQYWRGADMIRCGAAGKVSLQSWWESHLKRLISGKPG